MDNKDNYQPPPPPGYPTADQELPPQTGMKPETKNRGEKGFIEGCIAALCCCWLCEECCT